MAESTLLIQFAKSAVPGTVKTRLVPPLTPVQAADLHARMVVHTCSTLCVAGLGEVHLYLSGQQQALLLQCCRRQGQFTLHQQCDGDLGEKMAAAMEAGLSGFERVLLVGSDAPGIDVAYLRQALTGLDSADVVLGPARDGGYVLVGLKRFAPQLFTDIQWGSGTVLEDTLLRVSALGWSCFLLRELADIDRPEDLGQLPDFLSLETANCHARSS